MKLTKTVIDQLKYEGVNGATCIYWDDEIKGLGVRVFPSGQKTFVLSCFINGKHRIKKLERYGRITLKEARDKAQDCFSDLRHGLDPFDKKIIKENTFTVADLGKEYINRYAKRNKKTWSEDRRRIDSYIVPAFGSKSVIDVVRKDVTFLFESIGKNHPYEANRIKALISKIFNFAIDEGLVPEGFINPASRIRKFKEEKRDRWIQPGELPRLAEEIQKEENIFVQCAIWLYLLTGCRKNEILSAKWEQVNFEREELRLPVTKSGRVHYVPLSRPAMEMLQSLPRIEGNPYILPGRRRGKPLVNISKPWIRIRKAAGMDDVRLHDLRRSVGSWMASAGVSLHIIGKILNHQDVKTTEIYARLQEDSTRKALNEHGEKIVSIVSIIKEKKEAS